jgi:hypothetical protein
MKRMPAILLASALLLVTFSIQSFGQMPTPAPELKKLDALTGNIEQRSRYEARTHGPGWKDLHDRQVRVDAGRLLSGLALHF